MQLAELVAYGKQFLGAYSADRGFSINAFPEHQLRAFVVSATAAVARIAGRDSDYFQQLPPPVPADAYVEQRPGILAAVQAVLVALGDAIHNGHFTPPAAMARPPLTQGAADAIARIRAMRERLISATATDTISKTDYDRLKYVVDSELPKLLGDEHPVFSAISRSTHRLMAPNKSTERVHAQVLQQQAELLSELCVQLERDGLPSPAPIVAEQDAVQRVEQLLTRFHAVAIELRTRHGEREPFELDDEYDVQDLLRALLALAFADVRAEESTPSYAGGASRIDFVLKREQLGIEVKKTRRGLGAKEVGDQLIIDIDRYRSAHPDCRSLVCFVYDPEHRIKNPAGLAGDLSKTRDGLAVKVIITPAR